MDGDSGRFGFWLLIGFLVWERQDRRFAQRKRYDPACVPSLQTREGKKGSMHVVECSCNGLMQLIQYFTSLSYY
jgi:hypothetical protein